MIANAAFLAAVTLFLLLAWLAGELVFLAPYKASLFRQHGWFLGGVALIVFFNLFLLLLLHEITWWETICLFAIFIIDYSVLRQFWMRHFQKILFSHTRC